jgi:hypothetical protein
VRPSIAVSEEYNDNIFLDNENRRWDLITRVTPGVSLTVNRPAYQVSAGYTLSGELYANESSMSDTLKNQALVASGLYRGTRGLTLTLADSFSWSRNTNRTGSQEFATSQQQTMWNNTLTPGLAWEMTPRSLLRLGGTLAMQRSVEADTDSTSGTDTTPGTDSTSGSDSNTYGVQSTLEYVLTRRLTGTVGYGATYLDFLGEAPNSTTHIPTLGAMYLLTPTLTATVSGGPAITHVAGETSVGPAVAARLVQIFQIGSVSLEYTRDVRAAGGLGGTNDTQTFSASVIIPGWERGLVVALTPSYRMARSVGAEQASQLDVRAFSVPLTVSYQFARYTSVFAEYTYFQQQSAAGSSVRADVDQNRIRFGLQFGYPFNFD